MKRRILDATKALVGRPADPTGGDLAFVMTGGGARAAYQIGLLRWLARRAPDLRVPILTGVSAGAVNAAFLASRVATFDEAVGELAELWHGITPADVLRADVRSLAGNVAGWGARLLSGGIRSEHATRGLVDTAPLHEFLARTIAGSDSRLRGVAENLRARRLDALAISTTSYTTGESVVWVEGRRITEWARPQRRAVQAELCVEHVMASAALPLLFPAIRIGDAWYGDGGIRLTAPLSPALHLGARRILAISTRYDRGPGDVAPMTISGYPPPAQVAGTLLNAVFLDLIDQDAVRLERLNRMLRRLPERRRDGMRIIDLLVLRPSQDLSRLARDLEPRLPRGLRFLSRGLGTRETRSSDLLSMIMFQPDYVHRLIEIGEADAESRAADLESLLAG